MPRLKRTTTKLVNPDVPHPGPGKKPDAVVGAGIPPWILTILSQIGPLILQKLLELLQKGGGGVKPAPAPTPAPGNGGNDDPDDPMPPPPPDDVGEAVAMKDATPEVAVANIAIPAFLVPIVMNYLRDLTPKLLDALEAWLKTLAK